MRLGLLLNSLICCACTMRTAEAQATISTLAGTIYDLQGQVASSHLDYVYGLTVDPSDHLVFSMLGPNPGVYRLRPDGNLDRIAGNGVKGFSGDGGPAASARLNSPVGLAYDRAGNLYIADSSNHRVRKVASDGTISTIAGNGQPGFAGDGGPATQASLNLPQAVAVDDAGEVFIADAYNHALRKVAIDGTITTLAGNGQPGYAQPSDPLNGPALNYPVGVAVDRTGTSVYISEFGNSAVRKLQGGVLTHLADQQFDYPYGLALDSGGTLYIAEANQWRVWSLSPGGQITLFALAAFYGPVEGGARALLPDISFTPAVAVARSGTVCAGAWESKNGVCCPQPHGSGPMAEARAGRIFAISGNAATLVAGGGARVNAALQLVDPADVAASARGVYIFEKGVNSVSLADGQGKLTTVAGNRTIDFRAYPGGQFNPASVPLAQPAAIAVDQPGDLDVAATFNVLEVTPAGQASLAHSYKALEPFGLLADSAGSLLISDGFTNTVVKIARDGSVSTVGTSAKFNAPAGLAEDKAGDYYVVDSGNQQVRQIDGKGNVNSVAGSGKAGFGGDGGLATQAQFQFDQASGATIDANGALYVADTKNQRVRRIAPGGLITTIAGDGSEGYAGDGGPAEKAELSAPTGVTFDAAGNLYIADEGNNRVRKVAGLKFSSTLLASPAEVDISVVAGASASARTIQVLSSIATVGFQASTSAAWLKLDTVTGTTPGTATFRADTSALAPGVYAGAINITAGGVENSPLNVVVNLTVAAPPPQFSSTSLVNAASLTGGALAPSENVILSGSGFLGTAGRQPTISLHDNNGAALAISGQSTAGQIQFEVPAAAALGPATLTITRDDGGSAKAAVTLEAFAPGLYSASGNGGGVALAEVQSVPGQSSTPAYQCDAAGNCSAAPIDLGDGSQEMLLTLHGTGIRNAAFVGVQIGGVDVETVAYGPSGSAPGVDDVMLRLSYDLAGVGEVPIMMIVGNKAANLVTVSFQ